ncbi:hypothetical protein [Oceanospirillum linum]|uniref:Uncharacterized protein n=1 Tax=Oceanospirillum linum TaxID=966 RepID=A0A1T1HG13_OCELI|nr:hypothetical protein [Oceanospirillum linum]OOV88794.1 hypothetical protein BTA35_0204780 [Oceanospirillum linum]SEF99695.1 hypothetical protein SAMN04489856_10430 [Oleiphilus messinensis]SMP22439.1 hypothetical protein SAMN06264348_104228 [Oceanospirillum linum]
MEIKNPLIHLALLESLKANEKSDEIDLFLPFIAVIISELDGEEITPILMQDKFFQYFCIKPPLSAIKVFITRAKRRDILIRENHSFIPNSKEVNKWKNGYDEKKEDIETSIEILRDDFKLFAKSNFDKELASEDCDALLTDFIESNISSVATHNRFEKGQLYSKIKNTDHVTASFISHIHKEKTSTLDHFSRIVKGMVLANYLCLADKIGSKKKFDSITVYLDTPLIIGMLGFSGSQRKKSIGEFVSLLKSFCIKLRIFEKSLDEAEMLISAWRDDLKKGRVKRFNTKTLELLRSQGYDSERLDTEIKLLKSRIEEHGIEVSYGFKYDPKYLCDEKELEAAISSNFKENKNLDHDTVCISRVCNLRKGRQINDLNKKMDLFVTSNTGLVKYANDFFDDEIPIKRSIPLVVSEQWMTAIFWLKSPEIFNTLPMDQIVASAYGLLYTDDRFWKSFVDKLQLLEKKGEISVEDFTLVRWDSDLLNLVHDVSVDVGEDFSEENIFDIVGEIKRKYIGDKEKEVELIRKEKDLEIKRLALEALEKESKINKSSLRIELISMKIASIFSAVFCFIMAVSVFYAAYKSIPDSLVSYDVVSDYKNSFMAGLAILIAFVLNLLGSIFGVNLHVIYIWIRDGVSKRICDILIVN